MNLRHGFGRPNGRARRLPSWIEHEGSGCLQFSTGRVVAPVCPTSLRINFRSSCALLSSAIFRHGGQSLKRTTAAFGRWRCRWLSWRWPRGLIAPMAVRPGVLAGGLSLPGAPLGDAEKAAALAVRAFADTPSEEHLWPRRSVTRRRFCRESSPTLDVVVGAGDAFYLHGGARSSVWDRVPVDRYRLRSDQGGSCTGCARSTWGGSCTGCARIRLHYSPSGNRDAPPRREFCTLRTTSTPFPAQHATEAPTPAPKTPRRSDCTSSTAASGNFSMAQLNTLHNTANPNRITESQTP